MKKWIVILMMICIGGYGMTEDQWKAKLFSDAQDEKADYTLAVAKAILKQNLPIKYNIPKETLVQWAKEYQSLPKNKNTSNWLDTEIRRIQGLDYFTGYAKIDVDKVLADARSKAMKETSFFNFSNPVVKWGLIGLGVFAVGGLILRSRKK